MTRKTYIQHPITHKLIPKEDYVPPYRGTMVMGDIEAFVSPITKEVITSRSRLRDHNKEHGVTDSRDYSPEYMAKKNLERENNLIGNTPQAHKERIECVKQTLEKFGL